MTALRKEADVIQLRTPAGVPLGPRLPKGLTPEQVARQALALRQQLGSNDAAAKKLGIARLAAAQMIDIVLVADRTDLAAEDAAIAREALALLNAHQSLRLIHASIEGIRRKLWGAARAGTSRSSRERTRTAAFERAMGTMLGACANAGTLELPHLGEAAAKEALQDIGRCVRGLRRLQRRIEGRA